MRRNGTMRQQETGGGRNEQKTQDTSFDDVSWAVSMFFFLILVYCLLLTYILATTTTINIQNNDTTPALHNPPLSPGGVLLFNFNQDTDYLATNHYHERRRPPTPRCHVITTINIEVSFFLIIICLN